MQDLALDGAVLEVDGCGSYEILEVFPLLAGREVLHNCVQAVRGFGEDILRQVIRHPSKQLDDLRDIRCLIREMVA